MSVKRVCVLAMMLAIAIVLNILESFLPMIPGVKLGLANIIILIMLYEMKPTEALLVDLLRILLASLLRGNLLSPTFFMALSGGIISFLTMFLFTKIKCFSPIGVSVIGAVSHTAGQIVVAILLLHTTKVVYYLPFIALLSIVTGVLNGILVKVYLKRSITKRFLE